MQRVKTLVDGISEPVLNVFLWQVLVTVLCGHVVSLTKEAIGNAVKNKTLVTISPGAYSYHRVEYRCF